MKTMKNGPISHFSTQMRLFWALVLGLIYIAVLLTGAWLSGSLTLAADSAHMLGHTAALAIAIIATVLARRVAKSSYSTGYKHIETMGGYTNGLLLCFVSLNIAWEALSRHTAPHGHEIDTGLMGGIAMIGLGLHVLSAAILYGGRKESLNIYALYLHIFYDVAATLTGLATSLIIHFTGHDEIDSFAALVIAAFIFYSGARIIRRSLRLLTETLPDDLKPETIRADILAVAHVKSVHNMIFRPTNKPDIYTMSAHIVLDAECVHAKHWEACRAEIEKTLQKFQIENPVLQLESDAHHH